MMSPYIPRQRDHPAAATQLIYNPLPATPIYGATTHQPPRHPLNRQLQDPMFSNRPLFRAHSSSPSVPTQHIIQENLLRRKTPSGTLPAAYEAAPGEFVSRPTKQILLPFQPTEGQAGLHGSVNQRTGWGGNGVQAAGTLRLKGADMSGGNGAMFSSGWPAQSSTQAAVDPYVRHLLQQQHLVPPLMDPVWMNCQPLGFQPMYNPITPPTASGDEVNGYMIGGNYNPIPRDNCWNSNYAVWGTGQSTPTAQLPQAVNNMNLNVSYTPETRDNIWSTQFASGAVGTTASLPQYAMSPQGVVSHEGSLGLAMFDRGGSLSGGVPQNVPILPPREQVVVWAHKAYVDLLASIHAQHRTSATGSNSTSPSKTGLFPRLPKVSLKPVCRTPAQTGSTAPRYISHENGDLMDRRERMRPNVGALGYDETPSHYHAAENRGPGQQPIFGMPSNSYEDRKVSMDYTATSPLDQLSNGASFSPIGNPAGRSKSINPTMQAMAVMDILEKICRESNWTWIDGMLLGGCLAFGLGDLNRALAWYVHILEVDEEHVEALSNLAATLLSLNRRKEAEQYWRSVVEKRPSHLEAVEHLVGLLCGEHRGKEAVDIINYVETSLRRVDLDQRDLSVSSDASSTTADMKFGYGDSDTEYILGAKRHTIARTTPCLRTNPFMVPGSDNGRMLALIHAKGNMLYTLGDNVGAAKAFEDAVVLAAGIQSGGIQTLINKILVILKAATDGVNALGMMPGPPKSPVLLAPEKAVLTAKLVFSPDGQLPGLAEVPPGVPEKAAISTTSNSLLSLAKIFQDGMSLGGGSGGRFGASVKDILALYYLSLSLHPSPSTANNVGILLASMQQTSPVPNVAGTLPHIPGIGPGTGVALALAYYYYGLNLDARHAHLYTNLGSLLKDINHLSAAIKMYEQAVACDGNFDIALANLANAVKDQGRISDAIGYYRRAVKANPEFAEAVCGLANALNSVCDWKGRGGVVREEGNRDRWHVDDTGMLMDAKAVGAVSHGWMKRVVEIVERQLEQGEAWGRGALAGDALEYFLKDIERVEEGYWSDSKRQQLRRTVAEWAAQPYEGAKLVRLIERASRRTVWRWYQDRYVTGQEKSLDAYRRPAVPLVLTTPSAPTVLPFHTFTCPLSAEQVRLISERNGLRISVSTLRSSWMPPHVYPPPVPPAPYLRVGYVSSDFNNHPLAHLMQSVFGLHDRTRVEAYCYATTASDHSEHRKQIEAESPVFYDAHSWGPDRLVQQIVNDGIHILINLNGFTRGARNEVFAARPAPIQMGFMGFAGTLGAEWCDYLYADTTAVPPEMLRPTRRNVDIDDSIRGLNDCDNPNWVYAENIIFARYTFFCCDHRQSAPDSKQRQLSWDEETKRRWIMRKSIFPDLRDDQIILGNFNQLYKIEPTIFRTWLRILAAVPNAVLWLLRFPDLGENNLRELAKTWASSEVASRIIFTDVAPKAQHISRAQVCDLFLDTPECNAHTTAADVLWSGTPLLTLPRHKHKMCSRIAASILRAAVPQTREGKARADSLIADDEDGYESRAIQLARGMRYTSVDGHCEGELADIRKVLFGNRRKSELFNTKRWVRDLEDAYEEAWRRWVNGEGGDIDLKTIPAR